MNPDQRAMQQMVGQANNQAAQQQAMNQQLATLRLTIAAQLSAPMLGVEYARAREASGDYGVSHLQGDGEPKSVPIQVDISCVMIALQATDEIMQRCGFKVQTPGAG